MATKTAPWKRPNPRKRAGKAATRLSPAEKAEAKSAAEKAGRSYPNLIDNMRVAAKKSGAKKTAKKKTAKKTTVKKTTKKWTSKNKSSKR